MTVENNPSYPANFTISDTAIATISQMTADAECEMGAELWPSIMWAYVAGQSPNSGAIGIGFHEKSQVDIGELSEIKGFRFIYGVIDREKKRFEGKTIDVRDSYLVLLG